MLSRVSDGPGFAEYKRDLARVDADLELVVILRAAGYRGEVYSQLHALEMVGFLAGGGVVTW